MVTFSSSAVRSGMLRFPVPKGAAGAIVRSAVTFEDVVREHQDQVYGAALRILGDRDAALDAANQSLIPGSEQDLIRAYFSSLGESGTGQ